MVKNKEKHTWWANLVMSTGVIRLLAASRSNRSLASSSIPMKKASWTWPRSEPAESMLVVMTKG